MVSPPPPAGPPSPAHDRASVRQIVASHQQLRSTMRAGVRRQRLRQGGSTTLSALSSVDATAATRICSSCVGCQRAALSWPRPASRTPSDAWSCWTSSAMQHCGLPTASQRCEAVDGRPCMRALSQRGSSILCAVHLLIACSAPTPPGRSCWDHWVRLILGDARRARALSDLSELCDLLRSRLRKLPRPHSLFNRFCLSAGAVE